MNTFFEKGLSYHRRSCSFYFGWKMPLFATPCSNQRRDHKTTKLRIVFNTSSKSFNYCLYKGPKSTPLKYDILLRFRTFLFTLTADIQSVFLQTSINENDRDYLRFLWFNDVFADNRFSKPIRQGIFWREKFTVFIKCCY